MMLSDQKRPDKFRVTNCTRVIRNQLQTIEWEAKKSMFKRKGNLEITMLVAEQHSETKSYAHVASYALKLVNNTIAE